MRRTRTRVVVVGGGLVGLAAAAAILDRDRSAVVTVVEKESALAVHQSGRNSGVIHSGVYYAPGSAKARTCGRGRELLVAFAARHEVPYELSGKVVVAVTDSERPQLAEIARRGTANGIRCRMIGRAELAELEPHVVGVEALWVEDAGIIDYPAVARALGRTVTDRGGTIRLDTAVVAGAETSSGVRVQTTAGDLEADMVLTCAGLHADRVARLFTAEPLGIRIVGFRGEYHRLSPAAEHLCRGLVYPVPDPRFPFLGVHLTRHISGAVLAGPNAVPVLAREGYGWGDVSPRDVAETVAYEGFRRLAVRHWRTGLSELWRSVSTTAFAAELQRMTPAITAADLLPHPAGVRAQAVFADGSLADDFVVHRTARAIHVLNAPSPAATASLAIGEELATALGEQVT